MRPLVVALATVLTSLGSAGVASAAVNTSPIGSLDRVVASPSGVSVSGWALDRDTRQPIAVHVYVSGTPVAVRADRARPDVAAAFGLGERHGFSTTVPAAHGRHSVCVYAINHRVGANPLLGCRDVTVGNAPIGSLDQVTATSSGLRVSGWTLDRDSSQPLSVHVYISGVPTALRADKARPDVHAAFGLGGRHGFDAVVAAPPGRHSVCLYAINDRRGENPLLGCRPVTVGVGGGTSAGTVGVRDPWRHPFASTSPWNTAIGSGVRLEGVSGARTSRFLGGVPVVNRAQWSIAVVRATTADPLVKLENVRGKTSYKVRIPANTTPTGGLDRPVTVVQPDGVTAYDVYKMEKVSASVWRGQWVTVQDLRASGIGTGVRAAAVPAVAGLVRKHELAEKKIPHALAMSIPGSMLRSGYVWPAARQDYDAATSYSGTVPMGTLFTIPAGVNVEAMALSPEGKALARALQDYGAYVVDRSETVALYCELACDSAGTERMKADWRVLYKQMRAVTNSAATSVGGGGTPRVALAAALS